MAFIGAVSRFWREMPRGNFQSNSSMLYHSRTSSARASTDGGIVHNNPDTITIAKACISMREGVSARADR